MSASLPAADGQPLRSLPKAGRATFQCRAIVLLRRRARAARPSRCHRVLIDPHFFLAWKLSLGPAWHRPSPNDAKPEPYGSTDAVSLVLENVAVKGGESPLMGMRGSFQGEGRILRSWVQATRPFPQTNLCRLLQPPT